MFLFDENASETNVTVRIFVGPDRDHMVSSGRILMPAKSWLKMFDCLQKAMPNEVMRGSCQHGCGHESHLMDACLAGIWVDGVATHCSCIDVRGA